MPNLLEDNPVCNSVNQLQGTITDMDALAQGAFSEIAAIARLAIKSIDTGLSHERHTDDIKQALHAIWCKADTIKEYTGSEAEGVGCSSLEVTA